MSHSSLIGYGKKILRFLLGVPLTFISFYFIGLFIWNARQDITSSLANAQYFVLSIGVFFLFLFFFLKNIIWVKILEILGAKDINISKSFFLMSFSETKRYIPGSIFAFVARVKSFSEAKIPAKLLVKSLVVESMVLMISSMVVSIPGLIFIYPRLQVQFPEYSDYMFPAMIGILLCILAVVVIASVVAKKKLGGKISLHSLLSYTDILFLSILSWIFFGIGNYLIASSLHILDPRYLIEFASFFVLAWFLGYISVVTPMGLGVREGIMVLGLAPFAPLSITSLIAIFSRIAFMAGEFLFLFLSYLLYKSKGLQKGWKFIERNAHEVVLWSAIVAYWIYFTYVSFVKYTNFFMGKFDLGNMDQTIWNTLHGRIFEFTNPDSAETISRLAFHADFILVLLAPLYLIWSDPRMLLLVQTLVLGLGGYFVYKIALHVLNHKTLSVVLGICFLLNPLIQKQNLYDFHAVVLATTFFLAAWYFLISKRLVWMCVFLVLAVLTKENIYLITAIFGIYLVYKRHFKLGSVITVVSLGIFFALMKYFIPGVRGGEHFAVQFLSEFGDSLGSAILHIISDPLNTLSIFMQHNGLEYLKMIFLPFGFLPIFSPVTMIFAIPDITKNVLADNSNFRSSYYQYNAEILPFLFISTIYSIKLLLKKIPAKPIMYYLIFFAVLGTWMYGALPFGNQPYIDIFTKPRLNAAEIRGFLQTIDEKDSVAATNNLGSHLSRRKNIYVLPNGVDKADYVLFLNTDWYDPIDTLNEQVNQLKEDRNYKVVYEYGNFTAFKKL